MRQVWVLLLGLNLACGAERGGTGDAGPQDTLVDIRDTGLDALRHDVPGDGPLPDDGRLDVGEPPRAAWRVSQTSLQDGWQLASSKGKPDGETISASTYDASNWLSAEVPTTVVAAQVAAGELLEFFFGMDIRALAGMDYPAQADFTNYEMSNSSPYKSGWWFRKSFAVDELIPGQQVKIRFTGINHRAKVFLNGQLLADETQVQGTFRHFEFDLTSKVKPGVQNVVAVWVGASSFLDLAFTWVDWNPTPPDKNMGLWDEVLLQHTGPVDVQETFIETDLETPSLNKATLTLWTRVRNHASTEKTVELKAELEGDVCQKTIELGPGADVEVSMTAQDCPKWTLVAPKVWWPRPYLEHPLYELALRAEVEGDVSDEETVRFGIRKVESEFTPEGHRVFMVNGKRVLVRGAGYTPDMMLRRSNSRDEAEMAYVVAMNLNTIRTEGKLGNDHLMDLCDELGILVIAGWCCCDHWEHQSLWGDEDYLVAEESLKDQLVTLRNHPSMLAWFNASDGPPPSAVEQVYLGVLEQMRWPAAVVSSADDRPAEYSGPSGVKMTGPYEWVPPSYWTQNVDRGGAFGFNTETSPGPAVPPIESLKKFIPADKLWPINEYWDFHTGGDPFDSLQVFNDALDGRYGPSQSLEEYVAKADLAAYEGIRAMFEAYGGRKYVATGVIQWMLNNAWPSLIWHLYDFYLKPAGGFFGAQKACEPLHVQYDYARKTVVVVNSWYTAAQGLEVEVAAFNPDLSMPFRETHSVDVAEDSVVDVLTLDTLSGLDETWFLRLRMTDAQGVLVSENVYWLSTVPELLNDALGEWYYTPVLSYGDYSGVNQLAKGQAYAEASADPVDPKHLSVEVINPGDTMAFFVRIEITSGPDGPEVLPTVYSTNYISLWPFESRTIDVTILAQDVPGPLSLRVTGYNTDPFVGQVQ